MLYYNLDSAGKTHDFAALRDAVVEALRHRERSLSVGLDAVGFLDAAVIRELILALRKLREIGGSLSLRVSHPPVLHSLQTTGLDRVFRIEQVA